MSDGYKSRKFLTLAIGGGFLLLLSAVALLLSPVLDKPICSFDEWAGFVKWMASVLYGLYCGGNVAEKFIKKS
jgi:hypothetical protein